MGEFIEITAADGHVFSAYRATAGGESGRRGGVVVIQEIFGVNDHIRAVCDRYAEQGYEVHAPALFDRVAKDTELGYSEDDVKRGRELRGGLEWTDALLDVQACVAAMRGAGEGLRFVRSADPAAGFGRTGGWWSDRVPSVRRTATRCGRESPLCSSRAPPTAPLGRPRPLCHPTAHLGRSATLAA